MKKIVHTVINMTSVFVLIYFALPKILGLAKSVAGFDQFENVLHINADFFRLFTGWAEIFIAGLILLYVITEKNIIGKAAFFFLLATMVSALLIEFFVRPEPAMFLVIIATILSLTSIYNLKPILNHE